MTFAMNRILDYAQAMADAGVDVQCVGGNVPGGFLGRRTYDRYVLPFERKYIEILQRGGTPAMYHNCGEIMNLVESYKDLGVRVVEPFPPPPLGDADLARQGVGSRPLCHARRHRPGERLAKGHDRSDQACHRANHAHWQAGGRVHHAAS